ncbi:hypothetical protein PtrM4_040540 [Pyrenophora tritici-repentis]|uniref:Uncharacterized protein n=1 Tax=Pyrenophora tritici-repentis TaxID=45151 RepID=A0A834RIC8_9PLEO|nr:hypothetical protein PtrM4_040540 [Pyrenophora tritici-repentis]
MSSLGPSQHVLHLPTPENQSIIRPDCGLVSRIYAQNRVERILLLEQRPPIQAPTDEQLERVLRNILAERFSDPVMHHMKKDDVARDEGWFVKDPYPKSIKMNVASLLVPPESVPSQTYTDTFRMLEDGLDGFPGEDLLSEENEDRRAYCPKKDGRFSRSV